MGTPNDASEAVTLPDVYEPDARIKVEAAGNIFFDISRTNFTIVPASPVIRAVAATLLEEGCKPANGVIDPGEMVTLQFAFENIGAGSATNLVVSLLPMGGILAASIKQTNGLVPGKGRQFTNTFSFMADPSLRCGDAMIATLQVQDDASDLGKVAFPLQVGTVTLYSATMANTNAIDLPLNQRLGTVYPSFIVVSNLPGAISRVTVTLSNLTHAFPADIRTLLVGPGGQAALLLSGVGVDALTNLTLTLDDSAPASLVDVLQVISGNYQPTVVELIADSLPSPAPARPYGRNLSALNGTNPNGGWKLFVEDIVPQLDGGGIYGGWSLSITTSNTTCCHPSGLVFTVADAPDPVVLGGNLTYTLVVTNTTAATVTDVLLSNALPSGVTFASATPSQGSCANVDGVVTCELGALADHASATVTIVVTTTIPGTLTNLAIVNHAGAGAIPARTVSILTTVEPGPVSISISDISLVEGNIGVRLATFTVQLSHQGEGLARACPRTFVLPIFVGNFVGNFVELPENFDKVSDEVSDKGPITQFWDRL